jgi:Flp pilus assembly protein TadG
MRPPRRLSFRRRRGNILVLTAFLMIFMMALVAFAVDWGYLLAVRTELQRSADAAALAAALELIEEDTLTDSLAIQRIIANAREKAVDLAARNLVGSLPPVVDPNAANSLEGDVLVGYLSDFSSPAASISYSNLSEVNAVTVHVGRTARRNGEVSLFFGPLLGYDEMAVEGHATAAFLSNISGFRIPSEGGNIGILPIALDEQTWNAMLLGMASDDWAWDPETRTVQPGSDGIREVNLFPQGTDSPGNRGTVDIGSPNNSTDDIARQILHGASPEDMEYHGGKIELDDNGELALNGDTGISAGVKDELTSIIGQPRVIPVYSEVEGPGNNAMYTIVKFVGIRILEVKLTGQQSSKRVIIQPAVVVMQGLIPSALAGTSQLVYSPVHLVR